MALTLIITQIIQRHWTVDWAVPRKMRLITAMRSCIMIRRLVPQSGQRVQAFTRFSRIASATDDPITIPRLVISATMIRCWPCPGELYPRAIAATMRMAQQIVPGGLIPHLLIGAPQKNSHAAAITWEAT